MADAPTLLDVARAAGVSHTTASRALSARQRDRVREPARTAVQAAARRLGYRRLRAASVRIRGDAGDRPIGYVAVSRVGTLRVGRLHPERLAAVRDAAARNQAIVGPCDWTACALVPAERGEHG